MDTLPLFKIVAMPSTVRGVGIGIRSSEHDPTCLEGDSTVDYEDVTMNKKDLKDTNTKVGLLG